MTATFPDHRLYQRVELSESGALETWGYTNHVAHPLQGSMGMPETEYNLRRLYSLLELPSYSFRTFLR